MNGQRPGVMRPPTYLARPINGGGLELAPPKPGDWFYEPKYNGWRALVHAPTGSMFNRYGEPLSIAAEFGRALKHLRGLELMAGDIAIEWFDCEALDRRHALGRGTLLAFDYVTAPVTTTVEPWRKRKEILAQALPGNDYRQIHFPEALLGCQ